MKNKFKSDWGRTILWAATIVLMQNPIWAQTSVKPKDTAPTTALAVVESSSAGSLVATSNSASKPHDDAFVIGSDDILAISVWKEPEVSRVVPVRSDGKISLPLAGEVQAGGQTPKQLETEIATKLQSYIS